MSQAISPSGQSVSPFSLNAKRTLAFLMLLISHHVVFNPMASNDDLMTMSSILGPDINCPKHTKLLF